MSRAKKSNETRTIKSVITENNDQDKQEQDNANSLNLKDLYGLLIRLVQLSPH